jgi:hypothetical protein
MTAITLVPPGPAWLDAYEHALAAGWSPSTSFDSSASQLALLRKDRNGYFEAAFGPGSITLPDGRQVPR